MAGQVLGIYTVLAWWKSMVQCEQQKHNLFTLEMKGKTILFASHRTLIVISCTWLYFFLRGKSRNSCILEVLLSTTHDKNLNSSIFVHVSLNLFILCNIAISNLLIDILSINPVTRGITQDLVNTSTWI